MLVLNDYQKIEVMRKIKNVDGGDWFPTYR